MVGDWPELSPGERLLWIGAPEPRGRARPPLNIPVNAPAPMVIVGLLLWSTDGLAFVKLAGKLSMLVGMAAEAYNRRYPSPLTVSYAVTTQRIVHSDGGERDLGRLSKIEDVPDARGTRRLRLHFWRRFIEGDSGELLFLSCLAPAAAAAVVAILQPLVSSSDG